MASPHTDEPPFCGWCEEPITEDDGDGFGIPDYCNTCAPDAEDAWLFASRAGIDFEPAMRFILAREEDWKREAEQAAAERAGERQ